MCGIAGFSGRPADSVSDTVLDLISHRGPDGRGRFDSPCNSVSLFHTRLAIQDPSPDGAQPMLAANERLAITFNGEIYNFRELRAELEAKGHVFRSRSDTEVLLALYLENGTSLLEKLNGIFAFAIWDRQDRSLFLARDGMGVKPLYYCDAGDAFAFASEIKALLCFPWVPRTLDRQALLHYVRFLWCPAPRTPLVDVQKLEPGLAMVVVDGRVTKRWRHYELPCPGADTQPLLEDWISRIRSTLASAVETQLVSDVPVGAFLSGGLDSSAVVAYAREHSIGRLQCFTIDFDDTLAKKEGVVRDLPYARKVAAHLDVDLHVVRADSGMANDLAEMVWQLDEPLADFAALNVLAISRLARQHGIKVLLSGAGGDDLFTGYRRHRALGLNSLWNQSPMFVRKTLSELGRRVPRKLPFLRRMAKLLAAAGLGYDAQLVSYFDWASANTVRSLFVPGFVDNLNEEPLLDSLRHMPATATPLQRLLLLEQRYFLSDHNLNYTDKMSMAVGVEARVPFLDPDLVALAARIPDKYRQRGAQGKWVLKKAMQGILPREVIFRPKTGFGVPLRAWLNGPLKPLLHDVLSAKSVRSRGVFDPIAVSHLISQNERGQSDNAYSLLSLVCIELWCRKFIDSNLAIA